jgi:UPF0716 protein FxsA
VLSKLLLLLIVIPIAELWFLLLIGKKIGAGWTFILVVFSGLWGIFLVRKQGLHLFYKIMEEIHRGRLPADEIMDGVCILAGGILLLTPGLLTDMAGFALLFKDVRKPVKRAAFQLLRKRLF